MLLSVTFLIKIIIAFFFHTKIRACCFKKLEKCYENREIASFTWMLNYYQREWRNKKKKNSTRNGNWVCESLTTTSSSSSSGFYLVSSLQFATWWRLFTFSPEKEAANIFLFFFHRQILHFTLHRKTQTPSCGFLGVSRWFSTAKVKDLLLAEETGNS